ncbi:uncharacterized protein LOC135935606 isoform X2 [Cloeon dipterum]|uniref:uncharacterized protein LOC135935606 isoform X2 n=1 Tax=Cloeon dipterum TaxID=197152 RepID=UPI00321FD60E
MKCTPQLQTLTAMGPVKTLVLFVLLLAAASAADKTAAHKKPPKDGPEARVELDDDDFEEGEYLAPKTVLECMLIADWPCVQVKTFRAIREWLNIGTNVVHSGPVAQEKDETPQSKTGEEEENHEDQEEPDTDEDYDLKEASALLSSFGKEPSSSWTGSLEIIAEMIYDGVSAFLGADSEEEQRALLQTGINKVEDAGRRFEEARKRIGLGGHGHHGLGHLLGLITFKMSKIMTIFSAISTIVQLKALGLTLLGLLIAALRLFVEFKTKNRPLQPIIKVVHLHPRPHVTVNAGHDYPESSSPWEEYSGGYDAHDRAYEEQKQHLSAKAALINRYKTLAAAGRR